MRFPCLSPVALSFAVAMTGCADYVVIPRRDHGLERMAAIVDACRKRARPIVMTTLAMGAGMLPVAMGWVGDPSFRVPMAIAVIGGLVTSTFLSLLVIPVVYSFVDDGVARARCLLRGGAAVRRSLP